MPERMAMPRSLVKEVFSQLGLTCPAILSIHVAFNFLLDQCLDIQ